MVDGNTEGEVSIKDQLKKFAIKSLLGFQTIIVYGAGYRLGIFDFLYQKSLKQGDPNPDAVVFTPSELVDALGLNATFLDAWLHMGLACGIFSLDASREGTLKTGPHVYTLLVDKESTFYLGPMLAGFYYIAPMQDELLKSFKTGATISPLDLDPSLYETGCLMSARGGKTTEELFSKHFKENKNMLKNGGTLLEAGCGYGYTLEHWARRFKKAHITGVDLDPSGVAKAKQILIDHGWEDRVEIIHQDIADFVTNAKHKFDVIVLNQVLHEMNPDDGFRRKVLTGLHSLLNPAGILIINESMVPSLFSKDENADIFEIMHKWFEVGIGSKFYDEKSFKNLVEGLPFSKVELVRDDKEYFWALHQ